MKKVILLVLLASGVASASVFAAEIAKHHGMMDGTSMEQMIKDHPMMAKMHDMMAGNSCDEMMSKTTDTTTAERG